MCGEHISSSVKHPRASILWIIKTAWQRRAFFWHRINIAIRSKNYGGAWWWRRNYTSEVHVHNLKYALWAGSPKKIFFVGKAFFLCRTVKNAKNVLFHVISKFFIYFLSETLFLSSCTPNVLKQAFAFVPTWWFHVLLMLCWWQLTVTRISVLYWLDNRPTQTIRHVPALVTRTSNFADKRTESLKDNTFFIYSISLNSSNIRTDLWHALLRAKSRIKVI